MPLFRRGLITAIPFILVSLLRNIQNSAARVLSYTTARQHISPVLHKLNWLPIQTRIDFKTLVLTYETVCRVLEHTWPELYTFKEKCITNL